MSQLLLFLIFIKIISFRFIQSIEWTPSILVKYVRENLETINPNKTDYLFINPDNYISDENNKEVILNLLSSIYNNTQIKVVLIILNSTYASFGNEVNIDDFAINFTIEYFDDNVLADYITIFFEIQSRTQTIKTGKTARQMFSKDMCWNYLRAVKNIIKKKTIVDAIIQLLVYINNKEDVDPYKGEWKDLLLYPFYIILISLGIMVVLFIIASPFSLYDQGKQELLKKIKEIINVIYNTHKGKEIVNEYCIFCLKKFNEENETNLRNENVHLSSVTEANTQETSIINNPIEISQNIDQQVIDVNNSIQPDNTNNNNNDNLETITLECAHTLHIKCWSKMTKNKIGCLLCKENFNEIPTEINPNNQKTISKMIFIIQKKIHPFYLRNYVLNTQNLIPLVECLSKECDLLK